MQNLKFFNIAVLVGVLIFSFLPPIQAQTITENISLSFGRVVLVDNVIPREIELLPSGSYVADPAYLFFSEPRLATVTVDGYTPFATLNVIVNSATLTTSGGGGTFFSTGDSFTNPPTVTTDASGSATFEVGATLSSDGSGASFVDRDYTGTYVISVTE